MDSSFRCFGYSARSLTGVRTRAVAARRLAVWDNNHCETSFMQAFELAAVSGQASRESMSPTGSCWRVLSPQGCLTWKWGSCCVWLHTSRTPPSRSIATRTTNSSNIDASSTWSTHAPHTPLQEPWPCSRPLICPLTLGTR